MLKPDVEIYRTFLAKYGLRAEECLFIDDREENVSGAKAVGFNGCVFDGDYGKVMELLEG